MSVRWAPADLARIEKRIDKRSEDGRSAAKDDLKAVGWTGTGFGNRRRVYQAPDGSLIDSHGIPVNKIDKKQGPAAPDKRRIGSVKREGVQAPRADKGAPRRPKGLPLADSRFADRCMTYGLPRPTVEHIFHPTRRWRFDWAWPDQKVAVEQEGGIWTQGRHTRPKGYIEDMVKYNAAQLLGWVVLRYPVDKLYTALPEIKRALGC